MPHHHPCPSVSISHKEDAFRHMHKEHGAMPGKDLVHHPHALPVGVHRLPHVLHDRIVLDPDQLLESLKKRHLGHFYEYVAHAPAEIKLIASIVLGVDVSFVDRPGPVASPARGWGNLVLTAENTSRLADYYGTSDELIAAELEGAPCEMAVILIALVIAKDDDPEAI